jgi:hypothetical protein
MEKGGDVIRLMRGPQPRANGPIVRPKGGR